jgi:hypothetical protein
MVSQSLNVGNTAIFELHWVRFGDSGSNHGFQLSLTPFIPICLSPSTEFNSSKLLPHPQSLHWWCLGTWDLPLNSRGSRVFCCNSLMKCAPFYWVVPFSMSHSAQRMWLYRQGQWLYSSSWNFYATSCQSLHLVSTDEVKYIVAKL